MTDGGEAKLPSVLRPNDLANSHRRQQSPAIQGASIAFQQQVKRSVSQFQGIFATETQRASIDPTPSQGQSLRRFSSLETSHRGNSETYDIQPRLVHEVSLEKDRDLTSEAVTKRHSPAPYVAARSAAVKTAAGAAPTDSAGKYGSPPPLPTRNSGRINSHVAVPLAPLTNSLSQVFEGRENGSPLPLERPSSHPLNQIHVPIMTPRSVNPDHARVSRNVHRRVLSPNSSNLTQLRPSTGQSDQKTKDLVRGVSKRGTPPTRSIVAEGSDHHRAEDSDSFGHDLSASLKGLQLQHSKLTQNTDEVRPDGNTSARGPPEASDIEGLRQPRPVKAYPPTSRGFQQAEAVEAPGSKKISRASLEYSRPQEAPTTQLSINSLANAMVASSLASSRAPSPSKPPVPPPRRQARPSFFHRKGSQENMSRTPSPGKAMRQTLREHPKTEDEDQRLKLKKHIIRKHPNKHHEGDRKRYQSVVTEQERRRYEGVWAANRGLLIQTSGSSNHVLNIVVRDIWLRSCLPMVVLEEIWNLVSRPNDDFLGKDRFVVGMWLIDQVLKGKKLPSEVADSVWSSARGIIGVHVPHTIR